LEDIQKVSEHPIGVEMHRPRSKIAELAKKTNEILTSFARAIMKAVMSNSCIVYFTSVDVAMNASLYCIKYNSKGKKDLANALACALAAYRRSKEATDPSERTFYNGRQNIFQSYLQLGAKTAFYASNTGTDDIIISYASASE
jgi:hypothetical protein